MCDGNSLPRESQVTWKWDAFPWGFGEIGVSWKNGQIQVSRSVRNGSIPRGHLESFWKLTKTTVSSDFSKSIKSGLSLYLCPCSDMKGFSCKLLRKAHQSWSFIPDLKLCVIMNWPLFTFSPFLTEVFSTRQRAVESNLLVFDLSTLFIF